MTTNLLRFDPPSRSTPVWYEVPLDASGVETLLRSGGGRPAALVMENGTLRVLLGLANVADAEPLIEDCGSQHRNARTHQTTPLWQELGGVKKSAGALRVIYGSAGKLTAGVGSFLEREAQLKNRLFFLGVEPEIWRALQREHARALSGSPALDLLREFAGDSDAAREVRDRIALYAGVDISILVLGRTGTGKELVGRLMHRVSGRSGDFVAFNCAAIPDGLFEAEMFGFERGAHDNAHERRQGFFERASGGTLFIDEVGELPLHQQARLLRVLEEKEFYRLGGSELVKVDVRIVCATNRNLQDMVARGEFREDLYERIAGVPIFTPNLEGPDLEAQIRRVWSALAPEADLAAGVVDRLTSYPWPGNVRQLKAVLHRLKVDSNGTEPSEALVERAYREHETGEVAPLSHRTPAPPVEELGPRLRERTAAFGEIRRDYVAIGRALTTYLGDLTADWGCRPAIRVETKTVAALAEALLDDWCDGPVEDLRDLCRIEVAVLTPWMKSTLIRQLAYDFELEAQVRADGVAPGLSFEPTKCRVRIGRPHPGNLAPAIDQIARSGARDLWVDVDVRTVADDISEDLRAYRAGRWGAGDAPPWDWKPLENVLKALEASFAQMLEGEHGRPALSGPPSWNEAEARRSLRKLELVLECVPGDRGVSERAGRLAACLGRIDRALELLSRVERARLASVLQAVGVEVCKLFPPQSERFRGGRLLLDEATRVASLDHDDPCFVTYGMAPAAPFVALLPIEEPARTPSRTRKTDDDE